MWYFHFSNSWKFIPQKAAYLSALCLVVVQVGIGIVMKSAQTGGKYAFSSSGLVTISESLKFLLSVSLLLVRCRKETRQRSKETGADYARLISLPVSPRDSTSNELIKMKDDEENGSEKPDCEDFDIDLEDPQPTPTLFQLFKIALREVSTDTRYGFANLALLYALINNTIFVSYKLADPGTIALTRSGVIFITAIVMVTTLRTNISTVQWVAIVIQLCGLVTTQYRPESGTSYPYSTYAILLSQVFVSSVAGVYNQSLLKSDCASLHAQNTILYAFGIAINGILHITIRHLKPEEPSLFAGYTNLASYLVVISNVFIGLVITAVYKYADAVIKCLATAVATGILLFISPVIFGSSMTPLTVPGGLIVFISSWLYVKSPAEKTAEEEPPASKLVAKIAKCLPCIPSLHIIIIPVAAFVTILIVAFLETVSLADHELKPSLSNTTSTLQSPFSKTMGFIRWNHYRTARLPLLEKYEPFFHTTHYSMPLPNEQDWEVHNLTHDAWQNPLVTYTQVARTMQYILDQPAGSPASELTGMFFFHFDAWIEPLNFYEDDFSRIWIAYTMNDYGGPKYTCGTQRGQFGGWKGVGSKRNWFYSIIAAQLELEKAKTPYVFNPREWCIGWSDIYYIPREYFADYIYLAAFFGAQNAFHELVIPTILHIIDQTRRKHDFSSIVTYLGNCYGGCCAPGADLNQLVGHRCGHKLDYRRNDTVVQTHYERLDQQATRLGTELQEPVEVPRVETNTNWRRPTDGFSKEAIKAYKEVSANPPPNRFRWKQINFRFNQTGLELPRP